MIIEWFICLIAVIAGFFIPKGFTTERWKIKQMRWLWVYHLIFGMAYYFYVSSQGDSDASKYWEGAKHMNGEQALMSLITDKGTQAMYAINYIPSALLNLSFFTGTILYCVIGFFGVCIFYKITVDLVPYNYKITKRISLFPAILYSPNLHFWSSAIGKDTLLFTMIALFALGILRKKNKLFILAFSLLVSFAVRPHITLFLLLSFSMAYLMNTKIETFKRVFFFIILFGACVAIVPSVMEYTKVEELSVSSYEQFSQKKSADLSRATTGSRIDASSYPLPLKLFTFLYRPNITDVNSVTSLLAALENIILLLLSIVVVRRNIWTTFKRAPFVIKGLVFFLIIGTITFSISLGNLGIMLRMRNMFFPGMLIFICWSYSCKVEDRLKAIALQRKRFNLSSV